MKTVVEVFPARAGMNRRVGPRITQMSGVPRARGDEPISASTASGW